MPPLAISRELFCFLLHMHKNTQIDKFLCINEYKCESRREKITHTHQGGGPPFYIHNSQNKFMVLAHTHTHTLTHTHTHTHTLSLCDCDTCNNGSKQQFIVVFYTQPMKEPVHLLIPLCGTEWYLNNRKRSHQKTRLEAMHQRTQGQNTVLLLYI